jgi:sulfur carrier protein
MQIQLNGSSYEVASNIKLDQLIEQIKPPSQRYAIEINAELVPRSLYAEYQLQPNDQIEIVQAIGGG